MNIMFDSLKKRLSETIKAFSTKEKDEYDKGEVPSENESVVVDEGIINEEITYSDPKIKDNTNLKEKKETEENKNKVKLSGITKAKSLLSKKVKLRDSDISSFTEQVRMILLQSDVSFYTTEDIVSKLEGELREKEFGKNNLDQQLMGSLRNAVSDIIGKEKFDMIDYISAKVESGVKPFTVMFLGFNGTGKTTTIAKIAYNLKLKGRSVVLSASDTFRAAAIEQLDYHAKMVGVPIIKGRYGADPASIAFDAIAYARAHSTDCVLVDTSGRQETNKNLISELEKIARISKPNLTLFVAESVAGSDLADRIKEFNNHIKIDGLVLTKLDCDAKGGNAISVSRETGIPIMMFGVGEGYTDIASYDPNIILDSMT